MVLSFDVVGLWLVIVSIVGFRMVFKNACLIPADDPMTQNPLGRPNDIAYYGSTFEFTGPSVIFIPDETMSQNAEPMPFIKDTKWVTPAVRIPAAKWNALVNGHRQASAAGA